MLTFYIIKDRCQMHTLKVFSFASVATATQIILATLPLYSQNATWRSSTANTAPFFFTINVLLHRTTQKNVTIIFVVTFFSKRKGSPVLGDH